MTFAVWERPNGVLGGAKPRPWAVGQTAQRSRFFPCNAIYIMLKLSVVWRGSEHFMKQIMVSEPLGGSWALAPLGLDPPMDPGTKPSTDSRHTTNGSILCCR